MVLTGGPLFTLRPRDSVSSVNDVVAVHGSSLATGSSDGYLRIWDMVTRRPSVSISTGPDSIISVIEAATDGHALAVQTKAKALSLWDVNQSSKASPVWSAPTPKAYTFCKAVPGKGGTIACPITESDIGIFDCRVGPATATLRAPDSQSSNDSKTGSAVAIRQLDEEEGNSLVVVYESGSMALFDRRRFGQPCAEARCELSKGRGSGSTVTCMERLANELWIGTSDSYVTMMVAGGDENKGEYAIEQVDIENPSLRVEGSSIGIGSMAVRQDLRLLVVGLWDGRIVLVDVKTRTLLGELPQSHDASITKVTFLPDDRFAVASTDGRVSVWNTYQHTVV
ncbi:hypothetical protein FOZ62_000136 [Perkinsus olseni]|uniref:Uncharacterized protein n=1 Tax=Perkinsus olseni TaxID=32597 RepID=A0A7J6RZN6_PEROL|nr:hypothetical protein FOZ62_000136 [Perkinsus olseni]